MANDIRVKIIGDDASFKKALASSSAAAGGFEKQLESMGKSTAKVGKTLTTHVSLPLAGVGVAAVKMSNDFNLLISRLQGLAGVSAKQANEWRTQLLRLAPVVGKAPAELAEGLYQITSAGVKGKAAFQALVVSAKASAAGLGDTATVADAVTSAMNAYAKSGLTAKKAVDVLSAAVRDGKGEADAFAPVLGKVVAVGSQLGVSFDQVAAALAGMTRLGVPAEDAATQLSATFSSLLKTTPAAEKALEAMGLSAKGLREELREKGLLATLQTLAEKTKGSSTAMAEAFPNVRALRGILQLVGTSAQGIPQVFDDVKNSTNSLATAWKAYTNTDAAKMNKSIAETKAALIELGDTLAPLADKLAKKLSGVAEAYEKLTPHQKEFVDKLGEILIVAGPAILAVGKLAGAIAKLTTAYKLLTTAEAAAGGGSLLGKGAALGAGAALIGVGITDAMTHNAKSTINALGLQPTGTAGVYLNPQAKPGSKYQYVTVTASGETRPVPASTAVGGGTTVTRPIAGPGVTVPRQFVATHQTKGLAGFPALDIMAKPGTPVRAPENGMVTRISGHEPSEAPPQGQGGPWGLSIYFVGSETGNTYYMTHLMKVAGLGRYKYGDVIGIVGDYPGSSADHVHVGIHQGSSPEASIPSGLFNPADFLTSTGAKGGGGGGGGSTAAAVSDFSTKSATTKKKVAAGLTRAGLTSLTGSIDAQIRAAQNAPGALDAIERNAIKHIRALEDKLQVGMPDSELAKTKVALKKWETVLSNEVRKNAKKAAAAAAAAKKQFEQAMTVDVNKILRSFDESFGQVKTRFDKETAAGLAAFVVSQTPEEKALADFMANRAAQQNAAAMNQAQADLSAAIATGDPDQIKQAQDALNELLLDNQQAALEEAAQKSREAQDQKTADAQDAYQAQRDAQFQALSDANDDQRAALQNNLDDWTTWLENKKKTWADFVQWLNQNGFDSTGLVNPNTPGAGVSGGGVSLPGGVAVAAGVLGHGFGGSFAKGGVVPGALGAPTMILAHGGETVLPVGGGSGNVTVIVNGAVGSPAEIASVIRRELLRTSQRNGSVGLA